MESCQHLLEHVFVTSRLYRVRMDDRNETTSPELERNIKERPCTVCMSQALQSLGSLDIVELFDEIDHTGQLSRLRLFLTRRGLYDRQAGDIKVSKVWVGSVAMNICYQAIIDSTQQGQPFSVHKIRP